MSRAAQAVNAYRAGYLGLQRIDPADAFALGRRMHKRGLRMVRFKLWDDQDRVYAMYAMDQWRVKYAVYLAVALCVRHGRFEWSEVVAEMAEDDLCSGERMEPWEVEASRAAGPFTRAPGTLNTMTFWGWPVDPAEFPHPGPPPMEAP